MNAKDLEQCFLEQLQLLDSCDENADIIPTTVNETLCYCIKRVNGEDLIFTDYVSSGKNWSTTDDKLSVWFNVK